MNLDQEVIIAGLMFVSVSTATWLALRRLLRPPIDPMQYLDTLVEIEEPGFGIAPSSVERTFDRVTPRINKVLGRGKHRGSGTRRRLGYAGFHGPDALPKFIVLKLISTCMGLVLGGLASAAEWGSGALLNVTAGLAAGMILPDLILARLIRRRQENIFLALPNALDLMVVGLEVGCPIDAALTDVTNEMQVASPALCAELRLYQRQMHFGRARQDALHELGRRAGVEELHHFAAVMAHADRFGSSIASTLRELSEETRIRRRHMAEERVQKTGVKLLLPLVLFIFPGVLVVLVGPAALALTRNLF